MGDRAFNPKVDAALAEAVRWREEFALLRAIVLDCGLNEQLKWGQPCYSAGAGNIVLIHGFKNYCALLFMKGALLSDPYGLLIRQSENVQSARQIRFTSAAEIVRLEPALTIYVRQAIEVERSGLSVVKKTTAEFSTPAEFQAKLDARPDLKAAFEALTPGRRRGYLLYFAAAKQAKTRAARVEACTPRILNRKGLDD